MDAICLALVSRRPDASLKQLMLAEFECPDLSRMDLTSVRVKDVEPSIFQWKRRQLVFSILKLTTTECEF